MITLYPGFRLRPVVCALHSWCRTEVKTMKTNAPASDTKPRKARKAQGMEYPGAEQIRIRAYHLYLVREGLPGDPVDDWLRAEAELIAETAAQAAESNGRSRKTSRKAM